MGNNNSKNSGDLISGIIGITILKRNNKFIIVFSDSHSNVEYCKEASHKISSWINNKLEKDSIDFILEEVPRSDELNLEELWESEHFKDLKDLFLNNKKIKGFDIRPYLLPFSIEVINLSEKSKKYTLREYLNRLLNFFNYKNKYCIEAFNILIKGKQEKNSGIKTHFNVLKRDFFNFYNEVDLDQTLADVSKNNNSYLDKIDYFLNSIIEWYSIIEIFTSNKTTIIHTGLFHSINIVRNLVDIYNFKIHWETGHTKEIPDIDLDTKLYSCIYIPKKLIEESLGNGLVGAGKYLYF